MGKSIIISVVLFVVFLIFIVKVLQGVKSEDERMEAGIAKISVTGISVIYGIFCVSGASFNGYLVSRAGSYGLAGILIGTLLAVLLPVVFMKLSGRFLRRAAAYYNALPETKTFKMKGGDEYTAFLLVLLCEVFAGLFFSVDTGAQGYRVLAAAALGAVVISFFPMRWILKGTDEEREVFKGVKLLRQALKKECSGECVKTLILTEFIAMYLVLSGRTQVFYAAALGIGCGLYVFLAVYYFQRMNFIPEQKNDSEGRTVENQKEEAVEVKKTIAGLKEAFQSKTHRMKMSREKETELQVEKKEGSLSKTEKTGPGILYFARHGESRAGVQNLICGATDSPLTDKGREQGEKLAEEILSEGIKIDGILCSPLTRAFDTAKIVGDKLKVPVKTDTRLREQNFGIWEETDKDQEAFREIKRNPIESFNGGESLLKVSQRVYAVLDELKDSGRTYLIISHNGVARVMASYFERLDEEAFYNYYIDNALLKKFDYSRIGKAPIEKASEVVVRDAFDEIEKLASFVEEKGEK